MEIKKMTCMICQNGCHLEAEVEDGEVLDVTGNRCMRGFAYAQRKATHPGLGNNRNE